MGLHMKTLFLCCFLLFCLMGFASPSNYISDGVFGSQGAGGRSLLQAKSGCSVDFENQNYTIITSQCKGPDYPANICCTAFKEFACPFTDQINDLTNECASTMFSYINLYGRYPAGLFANECREGKEGLDCSKVQSFLRAQQNTASNDSHEVTSKSTLLMLTGGVLLLLSLFF